MAKYIVPPKNAPIIKCHNCKTLYVPEKKDEDCPVCGSWNTIALFGIPLWRYNLIKWIRGGFK